MILIEAGPQGEQAFDAKLLFAAQLAARGHRVMIDDKTVPEGVERNQKYEVAPYLGRVEDAGIDEVIVIGAEEISDDTLIRLRAIELAGHVRVHAIGAFADRQAELGSRARLAYALGREPNLVATGGYPGTHLAVSAVAPLTAPVLSAPEPAKAVPDLFVFLPPESLDDPQTLPALAALDAFGGVRLSIVIAGRGKEQIRRSRYSRLTVYGYTEFGPALLARRADIAAFYGEGVPGQRMAAFALNLMASGRAVLDCTQDAAFQQSGAPVLRGPEDLGALENYLDATVLVNLGGIGRETKESPWIASRSLTRLEEAIGLEAPPQPDPAAANGRVLFMPTNGNGLGHAQRCTLVAAELDSPARAVFAAFPSCVSLIRGKGFACLPLVPKSPDHPEDFANDILTYLRLRRTLSPADHLVFDGGYIFDSVYRSLWETGCTGTWLRRGLWRPGQQAEIQVEREQAFHRVIVPGEAFEELNADYSLGSTIRHVGPIVQSGGAADTDSVRARLAETFGTGFDTLVVTMLGGGVAADRSAQLQSLCGLMERRPRCLHLIVVWPNSHIAPGLFGWKNTHVVRTRNSLALARAADLAISAAGYNSFHELLYHQVPTIFIPQVAPFMDDQERRARAASDRDLAVTVMAHELLGLERAVASVLEGGRAADLRAALAATDLPARGNRAAAQLIEKGAAR